MKQTWGHFYSGKYDLDYFINNVNVHRPLFTLITEYKPKNILEVGCGTGLMSIFLSLLGFDVTALEGDDKVIKKAIELEKQFNGKVKFIKGDAFKLPFEDLEFDIIFHQGLLEHFNDGDIEKLLAEQLRVAKNVIFSIPNASYPKQDFGNERLLSNKHWDDFLRKRFTIVKSSSYNLHMYTLLKGRLNYKVRNTMYLASITK